MYERFFHLRERPFALSPDPDYLYPSRVHREALGYLRYGIESQAGFVVITGEIGSGKTTLLQALLRGLDAQTTVIRLMNTMLEPRELLEAIAIDLGFESPAASKPALLRDLATRLVDERGAGRLVLLVIDEAQNLGLPALEEIRMLSNLETEKSKLIQVVLVGQPDLRDKLNLPSLEQLRQRVTVSYHLAALDPDETEAYINHRLRRASLGAPLQFRREVTDRIHQRARGIPRLVNVICDAALVFAYAEERRVIDRPLLEDALLELEATGVIPPGSSADAADAGAGNGAVSAVTASETTAALPAEAAGVTETADAPHVLPGASALPLPVSSQQADHPTPAVEVERVQEVIDREAMVRVKEDQLRRREAQLAEQRRVLAEEYRLFQVGRSREALWSAPEPSGEEESPAWPPPPAHRVPAAPSRGPARSAARYGASPWRHEPAARPTLWRRVKQALLGVPQPVMEDRP